MKLHFFLLFFLGFAWGDGTSSVNIAPSLDDQRFMGIRLLDQKQLYFDRIHGVKFSEISDVMYRAKQNRLYLLSDEGRLFIFKARFADKIEELSPQQGVELVPKGGKKFRSWQKDSEGMALDTKRNRMLISFEGDAKIGVFNDKGERTRRYRLPQSLQNSCNFRSRNKSLEALAWHPSYGTLTVAEWPLKKYHKKRQTVYSLSGRRWHFEAEPEAQSAVTAIEVMDDGNLLVLERSYTGALNPLVITLKKVYLQRCNRGVCQSRVLAKMNSHKGWSVDNFEGLARVGKGRYVMVSDDNDNFFQRTLLIYFEVIE